MKTYQFSTVTPSYGTVRTVVSSDDPDAVNFLDAEKIAQSSQLVSKAVSPKVLKTVKWQLFTVKVATADAIKDQELQPLSKKDSLLALQEMKIKQNDIYEKDESLFLDYISARGKKARTEIELERSMSNLLQVDFTELSNQKTLTLLALRNPENIISSDSMQS